VKGKCGKLSWSHRILGRYMHATFANSMNSSDTMAPRSNVPFCCAELTRRLCCCRTNPSYLLEQECSNLPCSSFISLLTHCKDNNGPNKTLIFALVSNQKAFLYGAILRANHPRSIPTPKHHKDTITSKRSQAQHFP